MLASEPASTISNRKNSRKDPVARIQAWASSQPLWRKRHEPAIELRDRQRNHPYTRPRIPARDQNRNVRSHWPGQEHRQELDAHDRRVGASPSRISLRVHPPERSKVVLWAAEVRAIETVRVAQPVRRRRGERRQRNVREERVVEEGAFEDEVDQGIEGVPDEEESQRAGGAATQCGEGEDVSGDDEGEDE